MMPDSGTTLSTFLSTPSVRRATVSVALDLDLRRISIHALREEGDRGSSPAMDGPLVFLSTPSVRRATDIITDEETLELLFLSTPSVRRATPLVHGQALRRGISIHALREEGDSPCGPIPSRSLHFYPRPP